MESTHLDDQKQWLWHRRMSANAHSLLRARLVKAYLYAGEHAPQSRRRYLSWIRQAVPVRPGLPAPN